MNSPRAGIAILVLLAVCAPQFGCGSAGAGAHAGERYAVNTQRTLFYKYGPAQSTGPDFALYKGQTVTMLSRAFGYSHVATVEGQSGYVATEDLVLAPPEQQLAPTSQAGSRGGEGATKRGKTSGSSASGGRRPTRSEEATVPPPELPQSKPSTHTPGFRY